MNERRMKPYKGWSVTKLSNGRYRGDGKDSRGNRYRPSHPTLDTLKTEIDQIESQKATGTFAARAKTKVFGDTLDQFVTNREEAGLFPGTLARDDSWIRVHLRPAFGDRKLSDFHDLRAEFVKEWVREKSGVYAAGTVDMWISLLRGALDVAIAEGWLGAPNPIDAYAVKRPRVANEDEDDEAVKCLTLDEIDAITRSVFRAFSS